MNNIKKQSLIKKQNTSIRQYIIGFLFSIILTIIPFYLVINNNLSKTCLIWSIFTTAILQILIHLLCFLHIKSDKNDFWNILALIFTILIISIIIIGSLWIMNNLNKHMMLN